MSKKTTDELYELARAECQKNMENFAFTIVEYYNKGYDEGYENATERTLDIVARIFQKSTEEIIG